MPDLATCQQTLLRYLKARIPFISVRTEERARAVEILRSLAAELGAPIYLHTLSQGMRDLSTGRQANDDRTVAGALDYAGQQIHQRQNLTFILTEGQGLNEDTHLSRQLLDLVATATERGGAVVVITANEVWSRLQRLGMSIALDPPNEDEMRLIIAQCLDPYRSQMTIEWGERELAEAATVLAGVTRIEAENAISTILAKRSVLHSDLIELAQIKDRIFSDISGLERVKVSSKDLTVGGLGGLRAWLERQRPLLTMDLRERGIRPPRGVLLVGVPGCGKSLSAKAVAANWNLPLYRLDLANIHGKYLGQSESQLKEALATADRLAPAVLWIDEIEKGLAGASSGNDGGSSTRLLGHFLYWLQESRARIFVVSTANNVQMLPGELFRRGRFDEIFFVDLPTPDERREIIGLYARRYLATTPDPTLLDELVAVSDGFAGSDLDAAITEITKEAILKNLAAVPNDHWRRVFRNTVPLAKTSPEYVENIRAWGRERAVPASGQSQPSTPEGKARRNVIL
jgi:ATP-dependent 26S proteasome regulatory subunit